MSTEPHDGEQEDHDEHRFVTASPDNMSEASASGEEEEEDAVRHHAENGSGGEEESGAEDEDEEDEEEEDDDDDEPALKYERLGGIAHQLLLKDSASALAYANQRLVSLQHH